jgi:ATP-binding cassette, subfamily C, bacterial
MQVLTSEVSRVVMATNALLTLLVRGVTALVYVGFAMVLAPLLALVVSATGAAIFLAFRRQIRKAHQIGSRIVDANAAMHNAISEDLGGIKITKSHGAQAPSVAAFGSLARHVAELYVAVSRVQLDVGFWFRTASALMLAVFVYAALVVFGLSTAGLLLLLFLFARLVPMAQSLQNSYQTFVSAVPAYEAVMSLREECEAAAEPVFASPVAHEHLSGDIMVERVTVEYDPGRPVLADLTMQIEEGRTTAIVGPSGGGKSTLADLLIGLLVPGDGRVVVGGRPLDATRLHEWRGRIGYVPQDAFLFHDSVRANLLVTQPEATEEDIMKALRAASAAEFVARLPEGLDTVLGDRGIRVSGGERQRLALARALLRKPSLLVLDEATSNLDVDNERRVQRAIDDLRGSVTIVTIAHRIGTVRHADRIYVLDAGRAVESGTWDELLAIDGGRFRSLCVEQGLVNAGAERGSRAPSTGA